MICKQCGVEFHPRIARMKYHSRECALEADRARARRFWQRVEKFPDSDAPELCPKCGSRHYKPYQEGSTVKKLCFKCDYEVMV